MRTRNQFNLIFNRIVLTIPCYGAVSRWRGEKPLGNVAFWPPNQAESQLLWEHWKQRFHWAMVAKHGLVSSEFYFASTLTEAQINDLGEIGGKPREEGERTLISNLYQGLGHEGERALLNIHPHLNMETIRYPRFLIHV